MVHGSISMGRCRLAPILRATASEYFSMTCTKMPPMTAPGSEAMPPTTMPTSSVIDSSRRKLSGATPSLMSA